MTHLDELRVWLASLGPGDVRDRDRLGQLLAAAWPDLAGADQTAMASWKLGRLERPRWEPPVLTFNIARHGAMVGGGSTRAEIQAWLVDLDEGRAEVSQTSWRQVYFN